jgi:hypothetical protein
MGNAVVAIILASTTVLFSSTASAAVCTYQWVVPAGSIPAGGSIHAFTDPGSSGATGGAYLQAGTGLSQYMLTTMWFSSSDSRQYIWSRNTGPSSASRLGWLIVTRTSTNC